MNRASQGPCVEPFPEVFPRHRYRFVAERLAKLQSTAGIVGLRRPFQESDCRNVLFFIVDVRACLPVRANVQQGAAGTSPRS